MLGQMRGMISSGIGIFIYLFLVDSGLFLLPRLEAFQGRWILTIPYWIYQVLLALFVLLVANAFLGKYGLGLGGVDSDEMVTTFIELIDESPEIRELLLQSLSGTEEIGPEFKKQISQKLLEYYGPDELPSEIRDLLVIPIDESDENETNNNQNE